MSSLATLRIGEQRDRFCCRTPLAPSRDALTAFLPVSLFCGART